jgi:hypothetical protein
VPPSYDLFGDQIKEIEYSKRDKEILRLNELLWLFIHDEDPHITGKVTDCAAQILERKGLKNGEET